MELKLTPYVLRRSQTYALNSFDDLKVQAFFRKFNKQPGVVKTKLIGIPLNEEQLDKLLIQLEEYLKQKMIDALANIRIPYTYERINDLLLLVKQSDILCSNDQRIFELSSFLSEKAKAMMIIISENLAGEFRTHPSQENFFKWIATYKGIDALGCDEPSDCAPAYTLLCNKPYTVVIGDKLSKIALKFYGYENLWDKIYLHNKWNYSPDDIVPGQKIILP